MTIEYANTFRKYTVAAAVGLSFGFINGAMTGTQFNKRKMHSIASALTHLTILYLIYLPDEQVIKKKYSILPLSKKGLLALFTAAIGWYCGFSLTASLSQRKLKAIQ